MKRIAIFTSACCTGWCFTYDADDATQAMIHKHAQAYNLPENWQRRNCDGSVTIFDSVENAILAHNEERKEAEDEESIVDNLQDMLNFYAEDGDGRLVNAAWIVHMLLSDPMADDGWLPPV